MLALHCAFDQSSISPSNAQSSFESKSLSRGLDSMSYAEPYSRYPISASMQHSKHSSYNTAASRSAWNEPARPVGAHTSAYEDRRYTNAAVPNAYKSTAGQSRTAADSASASGHSYHHPTGGHSSAHSFPSPATSATSSGSSLRTPPDLLLNGAALATSWKAIDKQRPHE